MDDSNATDEDLELERYGLEQEFSADSEGSDVEDALYRQVHYKLENSTGYETDHMITVLDSLKSNVGSKEGNFPNPCDDDAKLDPDVASDSIFIISELDKDVSDFDDSKYSVGENGKKISKPNSELCINDDKDTNLCSSTDSGIIIEKNVRNIKFADSKQNVTNPISKMVNAVSATVSKVVSTGTKINRDDYLGKKKKKCKRAKKKGAADEEAKTAAEGETHNNDGDIGAERRSLTTSCRTAKDSGHSPVPDVGRSGVPDVSRSGVPDGSRSGVPNISRSGLPDVDLTEVSDAGFFLDRKGMALDAVKRDLAGAQAGWREEKERTKAMLRDSAKLVCVVDSDEEDDCMVVESCSEDERMQIHIDNKSATSDTKFSEVTSSGKRKRREEVKVKGRYFVQSMQKKIRCNNCFEIGHILSECPKPPRIPVCILCGMKGHTSKSCPQSLCFSCSQPGHQSRACSQRSARWAVCFRCQMPGHVKQTCTDRWRQYHLTTEEGSLFKPSRTERKSAQQQRNVYCSNCSRKGHRYYDCEAARFDEFTVFTYDEVAEYDRRFKERPIVGKNAEGELASKRKRGLPSLESDPAAEEPGTSFGSRSESKQQDHGTPAHRASQPPKKKQCRGLDTNRRSHPLDGEDVGIETVPSVKSSSQKVISSRKSQGVLVDVIEPSLSAVEERACRQDVIDIIDSDEEEEEEVVAVESGVNTLPFVTQGGLQLPPLTRKQQTSFCRGLRRRGLLFRRKLVDPNLMTADELATWEYVERVRKERIEKKKRRKKEKIEGYQNSLVTVGDEASFGSSRAPIQGGGFVLDRELHPLVNQHSNSQGISVWDRLDGKDVGIRTVSGVNSSSQHIISSRKSVSETRISAVEDRAFREDVIEIMDSEEYDEEEEVVEEESGVNTMPFVTPGGLYLPSLTKKQQVLFCQDLRRRGLLIRRKLVNPDLLTRDELATYEYVERMRRERKAKKKARIKRYAKKGLEGVKMRKEKKGNEDGVSRKETVKGKKKKRKNETSWKESVEGEREVRETKTEGKEAVKGKKKKKKKTKAAKKKALHEAKLQHDWVAKPNVTDLSAGNFPRSVAHDRDQNMMISSSGQKRTKRKSSEHTRNCFVS